MVGASIERLQAPAGGINTSTAPDYLAANQAQRLENLLPGWPGKAIQRGPIRNGVNLVASDDALGALWTFDNTALTYHPGTAVYKTTVLSTMVATAVTGTLTKKPYNHVHARYGDYVFGAIQDATNQPALGRWDGGGVNLILETNAPYYFTDVHVFAQRLFVLGGTVPGTTTPVKSHTLFWTDPVSATGAFADLSLTASWTDDVSGLVNQLNYDANDTPVALATCDRAMLIFGSRSINRLTGSGTSSFAITNLSKELGCTSRESIVETTGGVYFMSQRGLAFCDGSTVTLLAEDRLLLEWAPWLSSVHSAVLLLNGYLALRIGSNYLQLMHLATRAWSTITAASVFNAGNSSNRSVHRSVDYPLFWDGKNLYRLDEVDRPDVAAGRVGDTNVAATACPIIPRWDSRVARLGQPSAVSTVQRVMFDYKAAYSPSGTTATSAGSVIVSDEIGNALGTFDLPPLMSSAASAHRQRAAIDVYGEADSVYLSVQMNATPIISPPTVATAVELYDAWVEHVPAQNRVTR